MSPRSFAKKIYFVFFLKKKKCNQRPLEETGSILSPTRLIYSIWFRQLTAVFRRWPLLFFFLSLCLPNLKPRSASGVGKTHSRRNTNAYTILIPNLLRLDE